MAFSPVEASKNISEKYYRYLRTTFNIGEPYADEFKRLLSDKNSLAKGPYLDVTDTFESGKAISELIEEGILPKSFSKMNLNQTRPLYLHQEKALRKIAQEHKNIVVSTGTGSGKTESFLIPILRELALENENGTLNPGVRALLVYPMNALANDQVERLREILKDYPEITFGVYTGQTQKTKVRALEEYETLNDGNIPLKNELISREEMIDKPPHIFITNYAMLEYLMVRPAENTFFEGKYGNNWKFIVFDEAHVYNGSTGIEVSMLFRRLQAKLDAKKLTYILTSATLGDKEDDDKVAEFAGKLCNAPFFASDVIRADRVTINLPKDISALQPSFYLQLSEKLDNLSDDRIISELNLNSELSLEENLFNIVINDKNYWEIRGLLSVPNTVENIKKALSWTSDEIASFVNVASKCEKNGVKLFDARYHMFLRATESAFVTLNPDNRIMLERQNFRYDEHEECYKVFEVSTCVYCNSVYLVGKIENDKLEQYNFSDDIESKEIFLLSKNYNDTDDDHTLEKEGIDAQEYRICPHCGSLHKKGKTPKCEHNPLDFVTVYRLKISNATHTLTKCPKCENVNNAGILRMFFSGQEAATSVIGTALYEELPSYEMVKVSADQKENDIDDFDDFGDFGDFGESSQDDSTCVKTKKSKQFIAFSDSRQAAAFYASFLKTSYDNILYKRLIIEALKKLNGHSCNALELVNRIQSEFELYDIAGDTDFSSEYSQGIEALKALLKELVDNNGKTSLYSMGLLNIDIDVEGMYKKFGINKEEFQSLCSEFILSMLCDAAIDYGTALSEKDRDFFTHNGVQYSYTLSDSTGKYVRSFIPTKSGLTNKRVNYLRRIAESKKKKDSSIEIPDIEKASKILAGLWEQVLKNQNVIKLDKEGYKVDLKKIKLSHNNNWYICDKCHKLTCHNIEGVCPSYKCEGRLKKVNCDEILSNNHYYRLYNDMDIRDLKVVEHTAQLDRQTAYEFQNEFKQKEINVLSCSTTFEMGVDVGSLETVFMRNMPPSPANYAQRAGRAGRSKQSAAFALTFCNKASHDFSYFKNPVNMIKGKINPPQYSIENDRIGIRHLYASAFAFFLRLYPAYFGKISEFIESPTQTESGYDKFKEYLESKPNDLKEYLIKFLPGTLVKKYGVETFEWVDLLVGENGCLQRAVELYIEEVTELRKQLKILSEEVQYNGAIVQRLKVYTDENILTFLTRKNIMPKYGFPVDTVELEMVGGKSGLQLQRDLSVAISEYAPDSQIVANNKLITSRYIKRMPRMSWKMYNYVRCDSCKTLNMTLHVSEDDVIETCCQCGKDFTESHETATKVFLIPELGFIAESKVKTPGLKKPERTYRGEISYVGFKNDIEKKHYRVWKSQATLLNSHDDEMAVLNTSPFFVCNTCGYAEVDEKHFTKFKKHAHKSPSGYKCSCDQLKRYALGYTFKTDVVRLYFEANGLDNYNKALSVLYAILRGICIYLNIEESDVSGCLQKIDDGYSIVIFDNTPGGAGHSRRLDNEKNLQGVFDCAYNVVKNCNCGGSTGDTSCYSCLRNYKNQKYHDMLRRDYAIDFFESLM